jgi:2-methylcitrate dehydratase PrpD
VETFTHAAGLTHFPPLHTDGAQYSLPWAAGVFLVDGRIGVAQIHPDRLQDPRVLDLGRRVRTAVAPDLEARYPAEALARTTVVLKDGRVLRGDTLGARGDYTDPLSDQELAEKALALFEAGIGAERGRRIVEVLRDLESRGARELIDLL